MNYLKRYLMPDQTGGDTSTQLKEVLEPTVQGKYMQAEIKALRARLSDDTKLNLRPVQKRVIEAIILHLNQGDTAGLIKAPTGSGKTVVFGEVVSAINQSTLISFPSLGLISQTTQEFVEKEYYTANEVIQFHSENEGTITQQVENFLEKVSKPFKGVIMITNSSLTALKRKNPQLLKYLLDLIEISIVDEAHEAQGEKLQQVFKMLQGETIYEEEDVVEILEYILEAKQTGELSEKEYLLCEEIFNKKPFDAHRITSEWKTFFDKKVQEINKSVDDDTQAAGIMKEMIDTKGRKKIHLNFTATPDLIEKSVRDNIKPWIEIKLDEMWQEGSIIQPTLIKVGDALFEDLYQQQQDLKKGKEV